MDYIEATIMESHGGFGSLGIKILVSVDRDMTDDELNALRRHSDSIAETIFAETIRLSPKTKVAAIKERTELLSLFPDNIFVEEIPNGYCDRYCCEHLPWFVVTTTTGRVKIGWRKSVINIDWSDSIILSKADDLFPDEDTTKGDQSIHAWSLEKAGEYIKAILASQ